MATLNSSGAQISLPPAHRPLAQVTPFRADDGARIYELAGRSTGMCETSLALIVHPAGTSSRAHHHTVATELYFVCRGAGHMRVGDETVPLAGGDTITIRRGEVHKLWSDGPGDLELLVNCVPAYDPDEVVWDE